MELSTLDLDSYSPKEKAAILMISLGKDYASEIYKHLTEDEIETLTLAITNVKHIDSEIEQAVMGEFHDICLAQNYISEGGIQYAKDILEKAMGPEKAMELINRLSASLYVRPFEFVRRTDANQVFNFLQGEYPQTIALILSYLDSKQAATVVSSLPPDKQTEVIARIATMGATSPEYINEIERILERKLSTLGYDESTNVGGIDAIVEILSSVDRSTEKYILETLEQKDAELADEIRSRMFVFEDISKLTDQAVQRIMREVDNKDLSVALKNATQEVSEKVFSNMSKRLVDMIREDMEFMGPVRVKDVESAQQKIVAVIRKLEDTGEVIISRGGEDELIV